MGADYGIISPKNVRNAILIVGEGTCELLSRGREARTEDDMLGLAMESPRIVKWVNDMTTGDVEFIYAECGGDWDGGYEDGTTPGWSCFSIWEGWEELGYKYWPIDKVAND